MRGGKKSIFKLQFQELDKETFWLILIGMLVFTILVDRVECFAAKHAEHNMARQMYLNRLNAELMMFFLVSSVVFINEQFWEPTAADAILFEFIAMLCSFGACGLFLSGMVLFIMHHWMESRWKYFGGQQQGSHLRQAQRMQIQQAAANKLLQKALSANSLQQVDVQHCEYCIMSARFKRSHVLPDGFDYSEYLKLCLTDSICGLMNINWISWLVVLAFAVFLYSVHVIHGQYTHHSYVMVFSAGVWILAIAHILVLVVVFQAKMYLRRGLGCNSLQTLQDALREAVQTPTLLSTERVQRLNNKLVGALEQIIQLLGLASSFQGAFFVMHVLYNIEHTGWRIALVTPIIVDAVVLLPLIISEFTVIKAYYSPEHAIVDSTLEWSTKVEEDVRFVAKQLQSFEALEKYRNALQTSSKEDFLQSMVDMGLHVSPQRAFRIYSAFTNNIGKVDPDALIDAYVEQNPALAGKQGSLIHDSFITRFADHAGWRSSAAAPAVPTASGIHGLDPGLRGLAMPKQSLSTHPQHNVIF